MAIPIKQEVATPVYSSLCDCHWQSIIKTRFTMDWFAMI